MQTHQSQPCYDERMSGPHALIPHALPQCLMGTRSCTGSQFPPGTEQIKRQHRSQPPLHRWPAWPELQGAKFLVHPQSTTGPSLVPPLPSRSPTARSQGKFPGQQHRTPAERCPRLEELAAPLTPKWGSKVKWDLPAEGGVQSSLPTHLPSHTCPLLPTFFIAELEAGPLPPYP